MNNTCKGCQFWGAENNSLAAAKAGALGQQPNNVGTCFGLPPSVIVGVTPNGPQMVPVRPNTMGDDKACSIFALKTSLQN